MNNKSVYKQKRENTVLSFLLVYGKYFASFDMK